MLVISRMVGEGLLLDDRICVAPSAIADDSVTFRVVKKCGPDKSVESVTAKLNEPIDLGDEMAVVVVEIRNNDKIRVGIEAPNGRSVHRAEVQAEFCREYQRQGFTAEIWWT